MNPFSLHARNFRTFDSLDVDFPDGCVAVLGDNGAGKSSLVEAIEIALYGECRTGRLPAQLTTGCDDDLLIEVELEHGGELYRIRRTYSARGRGKTTLDFEWLKTAPLHTGDDTGPCWEPLTRASTRETQDAIEKTIGISHETFRASAFVAQKDGAAFTTAAARDRKRILAAVLGLERYDRLQEAAKTERRRLQEQQVELTVRISGTEELLAGRDATVREHDQIVAAIVDGEDEFADLEREHEALAAQYQQAREQDAHRAAAEAELREATATVEQLTKRTTAADHAAREIVAASLALDELPATGDTKGLERREADIQARIADHTRLSHERDVALREHDQLTKRRDTLISQVQQSDQAAVLVRAKIDETRARPDATCTTCGQHLDDTAKQHAIVAYTAELDQHVARSKELYEECRAIVLPHVPPGLPLAPTGELDLVQAELRTIRETATVRAQLEERIRQNEAAAAAGPLPDALTGALTAVAEKHAALEGLARVDIDEITRQGAAARQKLDAARARLEQQRILKGRLDERLVAIAAAATLYTETMLERDRVEADINIWFQLERAFGRDGIPALILENSAVPALEVEANRVLDMIRNDKLEGARIELRTQADLKSGDGVKETLDVVIVTEHGERLYETFSGGEATRVDLALRIALARLLATRRGAESKLLVVDEPDGLDEHGMAALVDVLRGLQDTFSKLYVVSHVPALRDSFDTTLMVRDGRVVEDGVFEAVAA